MALANRDVVAVSVNTFLSAPTVQGPVFGIVDDSTSVKVQWRNGSYSTGVNANSLDKITAPDSSVADEFVGRRVKVNSPSGQNSWGIGVCVAAYKRDVAAAGTQVIQVLLIQNPQGEYYIEALAANCTALDN